MKRAALLWLFAVLLAALYLTFRVASGIEFQTDLLALLPNEERDSGIARAKNKITEIFERRVTLLVGHHDKGRARSAGDTLARHLRDTGLMASVAYRVADFDPNGLGKALFPYRRGLLSPSDRARLLENREAEIVSRAIGALFAPGGLNDSRLLQFDPFLLFPAFLMELPIPFPNVTLDDGVLTLQDGEKTYVLITVQLPEVAFSYSAQSSLVSAFDAAEHAARAIHPDSEILRTGALFYSNAGAKTAMTETSWISAVSIAGTVILVLVVFRALRPLWFSLLSVLVGILVAFAASLWFFDALHIASLLFGTSLIGVAVDYSLLYISDRFGVAAHPSIRIRRILPGLFLGLATTLVGYLTLLWAPFPGLRQVAVFVVIGLTASFATVVLWLPLLDRETKLPTPNRCLGAVSKIWDFWNDPRHRKLQALFVGLCTLLACVGATRFAIDDDVRRLQRLPRALQDEELKIRQLTGLGNSSLFILVRGANTEAVLQKEEALLARLTAAMPSGSSRVNAISQAVPSRKRQAENARLVEDKLLGSVLDSFYGKIGMSRSALPSRETAQFLTLDTVTDIRSLSFVRLLVIESGSTGTSHLVMANLPMQSIQLREAIGDFEGVAVIDPVADYTGLFKAYRQRAVALLAISVALVIPLLVWRYGFTGSFRVFLPPVAAVAATPALVALSADPFTFFNAMALILVFSIGADYAIFCREADDGRVPSTMLGVSMAAMTTIMSFGLLALSSVYAVHAFGITLCVGITLAVLLAPLAKQGPDHLRPRGAKKMIK